MSDIVTNINVCFEKYFSIKELHKANVGLAVDKVPVEKRELITKQIPQALSGVFPEDTFKIKGSVGAGRLSDTPWVAVMNKKITSTTQEGVYIVFLFNKDFNKIHICLGIGAKAFGSSSKAITKMRAYRNELRASLKSEEKSDLTRLFEEPEELDVTNKSYRKSIIFSNEWPLDNTEECKLLLKDYEVVYKKFVELYELGLVRLTPPSDEGVSLFSDEDDEDDSLVSEGVDTEEMDDKTIGGIAEKKTDKQEPFDISSLISAIKSTNLIYDDTLIKRFAYSLLTKPFVILSGLAGSGKTQLALACAKALVEDVDSQICFVSVGADWTNREPLLGFPNALKDDVYQTPESGALQLMIEAEGNPEKPYFLILDEMNLSYVERYFADFLSAMEAKDMKIKLWDKDACGVPSSVSLPKNLFIVGTINVDETTYMFSPKVLDRANVIEFKVSEKEMDTFLENAPDVKMSKCEGMAANMAKDFVEIAGGSKAISTDANDVLKKFFKELKTVNAEFGYRTATEIGRFISLATENKSMDLDDAIDAAIVQKLLPKLHGSRKKIVKVLEPLFAECCGKKIAELEEKDYAAVVEGAKYSLSADKILRMYNSAIENGFTSFAEA